MEETKEKIVVGSFGKGLIFRMIIFTVAYEELLRFRWLLT